MGKAENLAGQKFGRLTALERDMEIQKTAKRTCWKCQCECGNIVSVRSVDLKSGHTKSCGCYNRENCKKMGETYGAINAKKMGEKYGAINGHQNLIDLVGQKFGRLTVVERAGEELPVKWLCRCDCGKETIVSGSHLKTGHTRSCGCLLQEFMPKLVSYGIEKNTHFLEKGERFGKLTILEIDEEKSGKGDGSFHLCKCDCGNIISVKTISLTSGHTTSCGCINSKGELIISTILNTLAIPYEKQKTFPDLIGDNSPLKFDFYIPNKKLVIEFQGMQHYEPIEYFGGVSRFDKQKEYDNKKRNYCIKNNIKLIEIPYWDLEKN